MSNELIFVLVGLSCFICGGIAGVFLMSLMFISSRAGEADEAKLHQAWIRRRLAD
jgi:hypothetical protein